MDVVVTSAMQKSCLLQSVTISDYVIKKAENQKFGKDSISIEPIQYNSIMRFIPLAMNHFGLRGSHCNAALREFASQLVMRPTGCSIMSGPFALSLNGALRKILHIWGSRLTWTAQRQHAAQILIGMDSFYANASFLIALNQDHAGVDQNLPRGQTYTLPSQGGDISLNEGGGQPPRWNPNCHQN
jgi:hypothetical protein